MSNIIKEKHTAAMAAISAKASAARAEFNYRKSLNKPDPAYADPIFFQLPPEIRAARAIREREQSVINRIQRQKTIDHRYWPR